MFLKATLAAVALAVGFAAGVVAVIVQIEPLPKGARAE